MTGRISYKVASWPNRPGSYSKSMKYSPCLSWRRLLQSRINHIGCSTVRALLCAHLAGLLILFFSLYKIKYNGAIVDGSPPSSFGDRQCTDGMLRFQAQHIAGSRELDFFCPHPRIAKSGAWPSWADSDAIALCGEFAKNRVEQCFPLRIAVIIPSQINLP